MSAHAVFVRASVARRHVVHDLMAPLSDEGRADAFVCPLVDLGPPIHHAMWFLVSERYERFVMGRHHASVPRPWTDSLGIRGYTGVAVHLLRTYDSGTGQTSAGTGLVPTLRISFSRTCALPFRHT
jgi:hypothetical protein